DMLAVDMFPARVRRWMSPVVKVIVTYQGFRQIDERDVVVIATKVNLIIDPYDLLDKDGNPVTIESGVIEMTEFLDPTHGYRVASYSTGVVRGSSHAKGPFQLLLVDSATLDRGRSKG